jgi:DNA-binding beta-propeller fold protein YncE
MGRMRRSPAASGRNGTGRRVPARLRASAPPPAQAVAISRAARPVAIPRAARALQIALAAIAPAVLAAGCATRWAPRTAEPSIALQWPYQPARAKVTFMRSLSGFAPERGGAGAFRAFVHGREQEDRHAFVLPVAVATGADGRIAVADVGRRCAHLYVPADRNYLRLRGPDGDPFLSPVGVAFDSDLNLYVSDSGGRVISFDLAGGIRFAVKEAGAETLQRPTGLAYSPARRTLYVVDTLAHRIHAFTTLGEHLRSFGERGEGEGQFNYPTHLFWAPPGELYVTNSLDFRIDILDETGRPLGSFGHHGDGSGDLAMPKGVAVDRDGVVYVADGLFDNVQLFDRRGRFLLTIGARGADLGEFWLPAGLFISDRDELYVCDTYNRRIQVFRIVVPYAEATS